MIKLIGTLVWPSSSEIAVICIGHVFIKFMYEGCHLGRDFDITP